MEWILDKAIQVHGAGGLSQDFPLAAAFAGIRTLRLADGPDEVHKNALARTELKGSGPGERGRDDRASGRVAGSKREGDAVARVESRDCGVEEFVLDHVCCERRELFWLAKPAGVQV